MGSAEDNNQNAPIAFVLVTAAGLSTCLGAAMVFNKRLVKMASKRFLAGSLGIAAGVMLYVSLVEIFVKSQLAFSNAGYSDANAYMYATVSLFGGIIFYKGIDLVVHQLDGSAGDHNVDIDLLDLDEISESGSNSPRAAAAAAAAGKKKGTLAVTNPDKSSSGKTTASSMDDSKNVIFAPKRPVLLHNADTEKPPLSSSAVSSTGGIQRSASRGFPLSQPQFPHEHDVVVELNSGNGTVRPSPDLHTLHLRMAGKVHQQPASPVSAMTPERSVSGKALAILGDQPAVDVEEGGSVAGDAHGEEKQEPPDRDDKLVRMGVMTAVAIGIHNFPEGLATFVGALSDPSVGFALAVAIAIHNIPEGLCVAIPVYYATGNRWKSFGWALLSGVSEPIGAGLGWLILKDAMSELVYGILFGLVAGMMINITLHELIPTAVRYDPADKVTTNSIIAGMAIMALSLTLFLY